MKLRFALSAILLSVCVNVFGQQQKSAPTQKQLIEDLTTTVSNQQETLSQLQADNKELLEQLNKMEQEIELYRGDVRTKIAELDADNARWAQWIIMVVTVVTGVLGIAYPTIMSINNTRKFERQIDQAKRQAQQATESAIRINGSVIQMKKQLDDATTQANEAKNAVAVIQDLKQQVENIQGKISKNAKDAVDAAKKAQATQLYNEALEETDKSIKIVLYSQAIKLRPNYYQAYNNRGVAKMDTGDINGALIDYNKAIELKPDYHIAYNNRGNAKKAIDHCKEALIDYGKAIELKPDYELCYKNRAKCYRKLAEKEPNEQIKAEYISKAENDEKKVQSLKDNKQKPQ